MEDELKLKIIQMRTEKRIRHNQLLDKKFYCVATQKELQELKRLDIELSLLEKLVPYGS